MIIKFLKRHSKKFLFISAVMLTILTTPFGRDINVRVNPQHEILIGTISFGFPTRYISWMYPLLDEERGTFLEYEPEEITLFMCLRYVGFGWPPCVQIDGLSLGVNIAFHYFALRFIIRKIMESRTKAE